MVILIILIIVIPINISAQVSDDLNFITEHNQIISLKENNKSIQIFKGTSEIKLFSIALIRFYQIFISSQYDSRKICVFTPSCSRFSLAAIKKYGILYGTLMMSDRLQRCNNFANKNYIIDRKTGKFHDPIDHYYFKTF